MTANEDPWRWVEPFVRDAAQRGVPLADVVLQDLETLLEVLRQLDVPIRAEDPISKLYSDPVLWFGGGRSWNPYETNEPILAFCPIHLRDTLIGPDTRAHRFLGHLAHTGNLDADQWGTPLWWSRLNNVAKGELAEAVFRMICAAAGLLTVPVKTVSNNGLDAVSIIAHDGRLTFASIDVKGPKNKGWEMSESGTPLGVRERIQKYWAKGSTDNRLNYRAQALVLFAAVCLDGWPRNNGVIPVHWRLVGGFSWPKLNEDGGWNVRATAEYLPEHPYVQSLKNSKPDAKILYRFSLKKCLATLKLLLEWLVIAEQRGAFGLNEMIFLNDDGLGPVSEAHKFLVDLRMRSALEALLRIEKIELYPEPV